MGKIYAGKCAGAKLSKDPMYSLKVSGQTSLSQSNQIPKSLNTVECETLKASQGKHHSAPSRESIDIRYLADCKTKLPIRWPSANEKKAWEELDELASLNLINTGTLEKRLDLLQETIYNEGVKLFGIYSGKAKCHTQTLRSDIKIIALVQQKNTLIDQLELACTDLELNALSSLLLQVRTNLRKLRRAQNSRKRRWKRNHIRKLFKKNPFKTGKDILSPRSGLALTSAQSDMDSFLSDSLKDPQKYTKFRNLDGLPPPPVFSKKFQNSRLKESDFLYILKNRRNASAPGPNRIPYLVYKKCPRLANFLFNIMKSCEKQEVIPIQWRMGHTEFIPKSIKTDCKNILHFRPLSMLNAEGKIFWALISKRIYNYVVRDNKFIDTSVQKGAIEGTPGCWEHTQSVWNALKDARLRKQSVSSIWLDIQNAFGSLPHELIFFALERYGVPKHWSNLVRKYYDGLWSRSVSTTAPSSWHRHERGIFQGCTISVTLFLISMNVILEYINQVKVEAYEITTGIKLPITRAFLDDLNLMTTNVKDTQSLLTSSVIALKWARLSFNTVKSRSFVIIKGRAMNTCPFQINEENIPSIQTTPIKFLGRIIDGSLSDRKSVEELSDKLKEGLKAIDKSLLSGISKLWVMQHILIPRIQWSIMIYEIPISNITSLEASVSVYIRKWLGLHKSISNISLYSKNSPCPLQITSLSSVFKSTKANAFLQLRDSKDPLVSSCSSLFCGYTWKVEEAVEKAEQRIQFNRVLGYVQNDRAGLGIRSLKEIPDRSSKDYRKTVGDMIKKQEDEDTLAKVVQMSIQGQWSRWQNYISNDLSWKVLWALPPNLVSFCIGSTYNTLATPSNQLRWGMSSENNCKLCQKPNCTITHILSGCYFSLKKGRYSYRHDLVLTKLVADIENFLEKKGNSTPKIINKIKFVKEGTRIKNKPHKASTGILHLSNDWILLADLNETLVFPEFIAITSLRPDMVLFSKTIKRVILIELTCPSEENMEERHEAKTNKYAHLVELCNLGGWVCDFFAVEVGARGYCAKTLSSTLKTLGFTSKNSRSICKSVGLIAMKASFWIWLMREKVDWVPLKAPDPKENMDRDHTKLPKVVNQDNIGKVFPIEKPHISSANKSLKEHNDKITGITNLGNTCYASSLLQALSTIPELWLSVSVSQDYHSPLIKSFLLVMSLLKKKSSIINPYFFLRSLKNHIDRITGKCDFDIYKQQDVVEVLTFLCNELGDKIIGTQFKMQIRTLSTTTCTECNHQATSDDNLSILPVSITPSLQESILNFLQPEFLHGENKWFCPKCSKHCNGKRVTNFIDLPDILIIQLKRFSGSDGRVVKDHSMVKYPLENLKITVDDGEVMFKQPFLLCATINHSGRMDNGHYKAVIKGKSGRWFICNDAAVIPIQNHEVVDCSAYTLFYVRQ